MDNILNSPSGFVSLQISEDRMSAWIVIHKSGKIIDEQEILDLIDAAGICYGFEDAIAWIAEQGVDKDYDKPFPVALCKPSNGEQKLTLHFDEVNTYKPDQNWSLDDIGKWTFVQQGATLADLSFNLFSEGGSIYNIFGEITGSNGEALDVEALTGENVIYDSEHHHFISQTTGYPYRDKEGKLHVVDSLAYTGDIRNISSPLILASSVIIRGSVINSKLIIKKDVLISGDVDSSEIYTEGNLTVKGKIISSHIGGIVVGKNLSVQSILTSIVIVKGTLTFANGITGSKVIGEQRVSGDYDHSAIVGSQVQTSGSIEIASAGNADGIDTELEVCISPFTKERMTQMTKALVRLKENPEQNADRIEEVTNELHQMEVQLSDDLNLYLSRDNSADRFIKVHRDIYPGVYVRILKKSFMIKTYQTYTEFME